LRHDENLLVVDRGPSAIPPGAYTGGRRVNTAIEVTITLTGVGLAVLVAMWFRRRRE
jgi:hypothetical protein